MKNKFKYSYQLTWGFSFLIGVCLLSGSIFAATTVWAGPAGVVDQIGEYQPPSGHTYTIEVIREGGDELPPQSPYDPEVDLGIYQGHKISAHVIREAKACNVKAGEYDRKENCVSRCPSKKCSRASWNLSCYVCKKGIQKEANRTLIFADGFESGDTSAWSDTAGDSADTTTPNQVDTQSPIFADGFESGDTSAWSTGDDSMPPPPPPSVVDNRPTIRLPDGRIMRVSKIEVTTIIIIIETPHGRFVLKKERDRERAFIPSQIMALAKVDSAGNILNTQGQPIPPADLRGSFGSRFAGVGIPNLKVVSLKTLADQLKGNLGSRKKFGQTCFENYKEFDPGTSSVKKKKKSRSKAVAPPSEEYIAKGEAAGIPAITGPVIVCGEADGKKALTVYDASGALIQIITQDMFRANTDIISNALRVAQASSDDYTQITKVDIDAVSKEFQGLPVGNVQHAAAIAPPEKTKKKKRKKKQDVKAVEPNDPLYHYIKKKKTKFLGILGGSAPSVIGGAIRGGGALGVTTSKPRKNKEIKDQYGLKQIGFKPYADPDSAWNVVNAATQNIVVAVVDSGLDINHPDGPQYLWVNKGEIPGNGKDDDHNGLIDDIYGWNFLNGDHDFTDYRGHGTFVTGIIAAKTNNGIGIAGINPGAMIMPVKVANENGETNSFDIFRGINYAVTEGARVINVSLGARSISALEQVAISRAHAMGVFVVVASGNGGESIVGFGPSSAEEAFAVGATDYEYRRSVISNFGPNNALMAPGEEIYSLVSRNNKHVKPSVRKYGYYAQSGTSFSAPMVAATASLLLAKNPKLTPTQITDMLMGTAKDMNRKGWDALTGAGFLNAAAVMRAEPQPYLTVMFTDVAINKDYKKRIESVDIFGTVRGEFREYIIEAGKGKRAKKFKTVAGPFTTPADYNFLTRIDVRDHLKGSSDWILRIKVTDKAGETHLATMPLEFE